jgi:GNAT superfamily N-acetyltransferase
MTAEHMKKVQTWIYKAGMLPLLFPEERKKKTFREKLIHGMFKGMLIHTMIVHWSHHGYAFLVEHEKKIIGFTAIWLLDEEKKAYRLPLVIADKTSLRKGIGSRILAMTTDFIRQNNPQFVVLVPYLPADRTDYIGFYTKNGFRPTEQIDDASVTLFKRYE